MADRHIRMTDAEVIDAIRRNHLRANIDDFEDAGLPIHWDRAWVDPGGTVFGLGPYAKVPVSLSDTDEEIVIRVYAPERLRKRLAKKWIWLTEGRDESGVMSIEKATEKIARRMAREAGHPEAMWELFLVEAYEEYHDLPKDGS